MITKQELARGIRFAGERAAAAATYTNTGAPPAHAAIAATVPSWPTPTIPMLSGALPVEASSRV